MTIVVRDRHCLPRPSDVDVCGARGRRSRREIPERGRSADGGTRPADDPPRARCHAYDAAVPLLFAEAEDSGPPPPSARRDRALRTTATQARPRPPRGTQPVRPRDMARVPARRHEPGVTPPRAQRARTPSPPCRSARRRRPPAAVVTHHSPDPNDHPHPHARHDTACTRSSSPPGRRPSPPPLRGAGLPARRHDPRHRRPARRPQPRRAPPEPLAGKPTTVVEASVRYGRTWRTARRAPPPSRARSILPR